MRKVVAVTFVLVLILGATPTAGAKSAAGPDATTWTEFDSMGAWVLLGPPKDVCVNESWIQSHLTFFRGGAGDTVPEDPFDNAGEFTAIENESVTHTGDIWWVATGRTRLEPMNPNDPCNPQSGFPVQGSFHGKGAMRITGSTGDGPSRVGTVCSLKFVSHLIGDHTATPPTLEWTGNFVAHCDDGAKIHLDLYGPTGGGLEDGGIDQMATGVVHDK